MKRIPPYFLLDVFRGLAALWVVMFHICTTLTPQLAPSFMQSFVYKVSMHGQLGVGVFFVISGYCIAAAAFGALVSGKSVLRYSRDRVRRIYPAYLASLVVACTVIAIQLVAVRHHLLVIHHTPQLPASLGEWLANLTLCQIPAGSSMVINVYWSLCYEVFFYIIIGTLLALSILVIRRATLHHGLAAFIGLYYFVTIATLAWLIVNGDSVPFPFDEWHQFAIGGTLFFVLELKVGFTDGASRLRPLILGGAAASFGFYVLFLILRNGPSQTTFENFHSPRTSAIVCLTFTVFLFLLRPFDARLSKLRIMQPFLWLGSMSYSLYLIHRIFLSYLDGIGRLVGLVGGRYWINFWFQVVVTVLLGRLFYRLVEKRFVSKKRIQQLTTEGVS